MNIQTNRNEHLPIEDDALDVKKYLFLILSNWYWFALSIFAGLFISYFINRYSVNIYSVQSTLIIRDESPNSFSGAENLIQGLKLTRNTKSIQNEFGILKSYSFAYKVISELEEFKITYMGVGRRGIVKNELYTNSPFKVILDSGVTNYVNYPIYITILSKDKYLLEIDGYFGIKKEMRWGEPFHSDNFNFTAILRNSELIKKYSVGAKFYFIINSLNSLANTYRAKLSVELNDKKGSILILTTTGPVAEKEADYQYRLMQTYIQNGLDEKNRIAENTIKFIDSQLGQMSDSLRVAEQRLQNFRSSNKVINIGAEGNLIYESVQKIQEEKGIAELKGRYYDYLKNYLIEKKNLKDIVAPSAMGVDDIQLSDIFQQLSNAFLEQETIMLSANPSTPGLNTYSFKLETLKKTLEEKVRSLIEINNVTISEINRRMLVLEKEMSKIPYTERLLIDFEREFNLINKMYTYLNEKRAEAAIARASNIADNKILDYPLPENASIVKPNRKIISIYGFIMGILIPFFLIIIIDSLNTAIKEVKEIHARTKAPILGVIGHNSFLTELPVALNPKSTLSESFRGLRTNLTFILREPDKKVIAITSTVSGEGKTFIAANLALIIALAGKKVLLVGLDLRKPKINSLFETSYQNGLSTYLIGKDDFSSVTYQTKYENLFLTPSGPIPPNPAELIGTKRMDVFIAEAKKEFDYIIVDTPPLAIVTDTLVASRFIDALLFVVRFNYSDKDVLKLVENMRSREVNLNLSLIVNDVVTKRSYGYSYGYGIKYGYRYSYGYQYGYGDKAGYYSDEESKASFKERIRRIFS